MAGHRVAISNGGNDLSNTSTNTASDHRPETHSFRRSVYRILETEHGESALSKIVDISIIALICASVVAVILESVDPLEAKFALQFYWFEVFTVTVFSIEYICRVWSSIESPQHASSAENSFAIRLRFIFSFHAIIDLIAILPFYLLTLGLLNGFDMRFLRAVRLLRVLKLSRYSSALNMLFITIAENSRSLAASFLILLTIMLLAASGIYYFERDAQPVDFGSIPAAMWWAFATLTTVGYGDVTPVTVGGKVFGAMITVVGVGMVALPTGILASGFAQQLNMRSEQYKSKAKEALDDGVLTNLEESDLENLRLELGLGKHTASQILDAKKVQAMLQNEGGSFCSHCGSRVATPD